MRRIMALAGAVLALLAPGGGAFAQPAASMAPPGAAPVVAAAPDRPVLDHADLSAWLDGMVPLLLKRDKIPGAAVVVVKDGQVLLQKGYGYADLAKKTPVDPERTLFRVGSVSKLFTWTAVMQQVEAGKLDLDADVNRYLDFKIPPYQGKPVTLRQLMHHTGGFTETMKEAGPPDTAGLKPLGQYLARHIPPRIFPPGEVPAYSNWGCALAGYIVERVSGETYEAYIERHIFQPLGMTRSTFRQPVPASLAADLSKGYTPGSTTPWYFEPINPAPAGALSATPADMAKFAIAHLNEGAGILRPETARRMQGGGIRLMPALTGLSYGFYELDANGRRVIGHGGATFVFRANLSMFPAEKVAVLTFHNSPGTGRGADFDSTVFDGFTDRYFPAPPLPNEPTAPTAKAHAAQIAGVYQMSRRFDTSFLGALGLVGQGWFSPITVRPNADGTIVFSGFGEPKTYREIGAYVWREVGGRDLMQAELKGGRITAFRTNAMPAIAVFQPAPWTRGGWNGPVFMGSMLVLILTLVSWPFAAVARRRYGQSFALEGADATAYRLVRFAAIAAIVFVVGWLGFIMAVMGDIARMTTANDLWIRLLQLVGLLVIAGAVAAVWNVARVWRGRRGWFARLWSVLVMLALFGIVWFAFVGRLMSLSAAY